MANPTYPALKTLEDFLAGSFEYLIVGGGTAGLAVACRLSEDPNVTVGVLEAGAAKINDPNISTPAAFAKLIGKADYDWMMHTVPQVSSLSSAPVVRAILTLAGWYQESQSCLYSW